MPNPSVNMNSAPSEQESPPVWVSTPAPLREPTSERGGLVGEKAFVYIVVAAVIAFIIVAVHWFSTRAVTTYADAAKSVQVAYADGRLEAHDALSYQLVFARAQDATLVKGGAMLLSFLVVILGVLMVLEGSRAFYKLNVEGTGKKSALETSSPGLVMITLGLTLVYGVMMYKTEFTLSSGSPGDALASLPTQGSVSGVQPELTAAPRQTLPPTGSTPTTPKKTEAVMPDKGPVAALTPDKGQEPALVPDQGSPRPVPTARPVDLRTTLGSITQRISAPARMDVRVSSVQAAPTGSALSRSPLAAPLPSGLGMAVPGTLNASAPLTQLPASSSSAARALLPQLSPSNLSSQH